MVDTDTDANADAADEVVVDAEKEIIDGVDKIDRVDEIVARNQPTGES